ncbi:MAG: hypothetical protein QW512_02405 [Thermofilaceae archaeon]
MFALGDLQFETMDRVNALSIYTKMLSRALDRNASADVIATCAKLVRRADRRLARWVRAHIHDLDLRLRDSVAIARVLANAALVRAKAYIAEANKNGKQKKRKGAQKQG